MQKATTGTVNYGEVALTVGVTALTGGAGKFLNSGKMLEAVAPRGLQALGTRVGVNAVAGGVSSEGSYMLTNNGKMSLGAGSSGFVTGGIGGFAGPGGGTYAREVLGKTATSFQAHLATGIINYSGGVMGSAIQQGVDTGSVDPGTASMAGITNVGGSIVADKLFSASSAVDPVTLKQLSHFGVRSGAGIRQMGKGATQLMVSSFGGAAIGEFVSYLA